MALKLARAGAATEAARHRRDKLIAEAYKAGAGLREIARVVGLTHPAVRQILIRDGVFHFPEGYESIRDVGTTSRED